MKRALLFIGVALLLFALDAALKNYVYHTIPLMSVSTPVYPYGGIGEAVSSLIFNFPCLAGRQEFSIFNFVHLCVRKIPRSGAPEELLSFEEINAAAIIKKAKEIVK